MHEGPSEVVGVESARLSCPNAYKIGERIEISLNNPIIDAMTRAIVKHTDGLRLQVDFGHEQTALIHDWQIVK